MNDFQKKHQKVVEHILSTFRFNCLKSSCGELKRPYVSPGSSAYSQDLWDWDSFWVITAMTSLFRQQGDSVALKAFAPYARGCFFNFLDHQGRDGAIPILIQPEQEDLFFCKSSVDNNMAKPFIAQMARVLWDNGFLTDAELKDALPKVHAFHQCYRMRFLHPETGLVFWGKDWGIGVDDDPAAWGRPNKSCASIFLNSFLYSDYTAMVELEQIVKNSKLVGEYCELKNALAESIGKYCYDARENAYFSVDIQCRPNLFRHPFFQVLNKNLDTFWHCLKLKVLSWNSILPFWCGLGSDEQFEKFVRFNLTPERLLGKFGVRSLSADESMYQPEIARGNPSNWLGPVWVLTNYIVWDTLRKRKVYGLADKIAENMINVLYMDIETSGCFHEYYSPETGLGICNPHFMSWNSLAAIMTVNH